MTFDELKTVWIEIPNWSKYNPRRDVKATSWVRLENTIFDGQTFEEFSHAELCVWLYIMCCASKKQSGTIQFNFSNAARIARVDREEAATALKKLLELRCVRILEGDPHDDVTHTSRMRDVDVTLRTDGRTDETDGRTDAATSSAANADVTQPELMPDAVAEAPRRSKSGLTAADLQQLVEPPIHELLTRVSHAVGVGWLETFPDPDWIRSELRKARLWCLANPQKAPRSSWARFLSSWLGRAWEDRRRAIPGKPGGAQAAADSNRALAERIRRGEA